MEKNLKKIVTKFMKQNIYEPRTLREMILKEKEFP